MSPRDNHELYPCTQEPLIKSIREDMDSLTAVVIGFPPEYEGGLRRDIRSVQEQLKYNAQEAEKSRRRIKFIWMVAIAITGKLSVDGVLTAIKWLGKITVAS